MTLATIHLELPDRLLACALVAYLLSGALPVRAEDAPLPSDRRALETPPPPEADETTRGFDLPPPPGGSSETSEMIQGRWEEDPRVERREQHLRLTTAAYGFAGAFAGLAALSLFYSYTLAPEDSATRHAWQVAALSFGALSLAGLVTGTVLALTTPEAPALARGPRPRLEVALGPGGAALRLRLTFF